MDEEILDILNGTVRSPEETRTEQERIPETAPTVTSTPCSSGRRRLRKNTIKTSAKASRNSAKKSSAPYSTEATRKRQRQESATAASASPRLKMPMQLTTQLSVEPNPTPSAPPSSATTQEESADKPKSMFEQFKEYMDGQFTDLKKDIKSDVSASVTKLTEQVNTNSTTIKRIETELRDGLEEKVAAAVGRKIRRIESTATGRAPSSQICNISVSDPENYWRARRAIRCWPIMCGNDSLWATVGDFFHITLQIPTSKLQQSSVESIRRVPARRRDDQRIRDEVIVTFCDVATRDLVYSYAPNLARLRSDPSPPGIRIEIPQQLTGVFKTLHEYGSSLRRTLGETFKRSIKFDDQRLSMYIDVLIPGDSSWTRVEYEVAAEEVEKRRRTASAGARERLSSLSSQGSTSSNNLRPISQDARMLALPRSETIAARNAPQTVPPRWTGNP